jgi:phenylalanyl-tRNA synthetase alpha chain
MAPAENGLLAGDLPVEILQKLNDKGDPLLSAEAFPHVKPVEMRSAIDKLASREMVKFDTLEKEVIILEPEGEQIAASGSHEVRVFEAVRQALEGLSIADLEKQIGDKTVLRAGQGKAFKEKWITKTGDGKLKALVALPLHTRVSG